MIWMLAACTPTPTPTVTPTETPPEGAERIELTTRDDVQLVADAYRGPAGAPAVLLLHMIPPANDRTTWPASFIASLQAEGWWVVALDRRGAGESGGVAQEAYLGPNGRYDAEAAALWLEAEGAGDLAILGASNGTTTALDYALWAGEADRPVPVALGFMTGGTYTEAQNEVSSLTVPAVFTYSTAERAWSVDQQSGAPESWVFHEYANGDHGTRMFDAEPSVADDLIAFLGGVL